MKVFVYTKDKDSRLIAVFKDVNTIREIKPEKLIEIYTDDTYVHFSTKKVKTRIYQN